MIVYGHTKTKPSSSVVYVAQDYFKTQVLCILCDCYGLHKWLLILNFLEHALGQSQRRDDIFLNV